MKQKILFICTHNSARSQMAEAFTKEIYGDRFEAYSAGTHPGKLNPYAIKVLTEKGIDISKNHTKSVELFLGVQFDYVVTVCDGAKASCPFFPGAVKYIHQGFRDPSTFSGSKDEILALVREVRDEIENWIKKTFSENSQTSNNFLKINI